MGLDEVPGVLHGVHAGGVVGLKKGSTPFNGRLRYALYISFAAAMDGHAMKWLPAYPSTEALTMPLIVH